MRKAGFALLFAAIMLACARLYTGIVYGRDAPIGALIVKRSPNLTIERAETPARPLEREIILDREEPTLFYGRPYLWLMHAAPAVMLVMIAGAMFLLLRRAPRS